MDQIRNEIDKFTYCWVDVWLSDWLDVSFPDISTYRINLVKPSILAYCVLAT